MNVSSTLDTPTPVKKGTQLPATFIFRRMHSLLGLWLVVYLFEHLLVNAQAALFKSDHGQAFIRMVNGINHLPFLHVIEIMLLAFPFLMHGIWGIWYLRSMKINSSPTDGTKPSLSHYPRNKAYTWQRITSIVLVIGILAHVVQMRFLSYPASTMQGQNQVYFVRLHEDTLLQETVLKISGTIITQQEIDKKEQLWIQEKEKLNQKAVSPVLKNEVEELSSWVAASKKKPLKPGQVLVAVPDVGSAILLVVRDTFKSPSMVILYSLLVLAAVFHAFNGLWTFCITWGITLSERSQKWMRKVSNVLMVIVAFLGLMAAWGTYFTLIH